MLADVEMETKGPESICLAKPGDRVAEDAATADLPGEITSGPSGCCTEAAGVPLMNDASGPAAGVGTDVDTFMLYHFTSVAILNHELN